MFGADKGKADNLDGRGLRIGIVQARFNESITNELAGACLGELEALGVRTADITHVHVPGALEIPLALQALARQGGLDALVALGCVIRGETYHFELVANESAAGINRVSLDSGLPIANVVLTTNTLGQALARQTDKGVDAARVVVEMARLVEKLR
jgi:6,7-dimethyl-8-ribityllumazine synthase